MASVQWLPLNQAAKQFGYKSIQGFRLRIQQLRNKGYVVDEGNPPEEYKKKQGNGAITLLWANPQAAMIRADAQADLLNPKTGKRKQPLQAATANQ